MTPTLLALAALAIAGAGFGAGWGLKPDPDVAEQIRAQGEATAALGAQVARVAETAGRPVVIDAELRATLAEIPVQCIETAGGDPMSAACAWATCLQFGQSAAQRPECRAVEAAMVASLTGCVEPAP